MASLIPHHGEEDAIRIANDSELGLSGAVFTADDAHGFEIARQDARPGRSRSTPSPPTWAHPSVATRSRASAASTGRRPTRSSCTTRPSRSTRAGSSRSPSPPAYAAGRAPARLPDRLRAGRPLPDRPRDQAHSSPPTPRHRPQERRWKTATRTSSRRSGSVASTCATGSWRCRPAPASSRAASRPTATWSTSSGSRRVASGWSSPAPWSSTRPPRCARASWSRPTSTRSCPR